MKTYALPLPDPKKQIKPPPRPWGRRILKGVLWVAGVFVAAHAVALWFLTRS